MPEIGVHADAPAVLQLLDHGGEAGALERVADAVGAAVDGVDDPARERGGQLAAVVADRLARARKVFVDRDGSTRATGDLLLAEGTDTLRGAGFAVRAALN